MYLKQLKISILATVVLTVVTGLVYPLIDGNSRRFCFHVKPTAVPVYKDGKAVGSHLIGQPFDDPKYFWSRLSATSPQPYNASNSSGSNLGPTNPALIQEVQGRIDALEEAGRTTTNSIPVDLVTSSASGLDHTSHPRPRSIG